jgi:hypothetical protein
MKVHYEKGDTVYLLSDYGNNRLEVVGIKQQGLVVVDSYGERSHHSFGSVEATPVTLAAATVVFLDHAKANAVRKVVNHVRLAHTFTMSDFGKGLEEGFDDFREKALAKAELIEQGKF